MLLPVIMDHYIILKANFKSRVEIVVVSSVDLLMKFFKVKGEFKQLDLIIEELKLLPMDLIPEFNSMGRFKMIEVKSKQ